MTRDEFKKLCKLHLINITAVAAIAGIKANSLSIIINKNPDAIPQDLEFILLGLVARASGLDQAFYSGGVLEVAKRAIKHSNNKLLNDVLRELDERQIIYNQMIDKKKASKAPPLSKPDPVK